MISLLPTIDSSAQLGWSCAGNFVVVINSNEKASQPEVTAGAPQRPTHYPHTTQLSRQPRVKPPVRGSPELFRVSFTKQT